MDSKEQYRKYLTSALESCFKLPANVPPAEYSAQQLAYLNTALYIQGKHPFFKPGNPKPCIDISSGGIYSGAASSTLDLSACSNNQASRLFIPYKQAERLFITPVVKNSVIVIFKENSSPLIGNDSSKPKIIIKKLVNMDNFTNNKNIMKLIFPGYDKIEGKVNKYAEGNLQSYRKNLNNPDLVSKVMENSQSNGSSILPKFTHELKNYELCKRIGTQFTPLFTEEEHLKEAAIAFQTNPREALRAFQQSANISGKFVSSILVKEKENTITNEAIKTTAALPMSNKNTENVQDLTRGGRENERK